MNGLALSHAYYEQFGERMLMEKFPDLFPHLAVGKVGEGSDAFGYDDEISRDHDFEVGFYIFAPDDTPRATLFALERAYAALPRSFMGIERPRLAPPGGRRCGVLTVSEFYEKLLGVATPPTDSLLFYRLPDYALATATNGEVFYDGAGDFSHRRAGFATLPDDVRLQKLSAALIAAGQSGLYNYPRCVAHKERGAAQLAIHEFVKNALQIAFLLDKKHPPFYKWVFRAMETLPRFSFLTSRLTFLLTTENTPALAHRKEDFITVIAHHFSDALRAEGLSSLPGYELEAHAYEVKRKISPKSPLYPLSVWG